MDFEQIRKIDDEFRRVEATYEIFNEDTRLNGSQAARVEFLTTVRYIEKYLQEGMKILDIGAGAGEYSLYFAKRNFSVDALELSESNIRAFEKKIRNDMELKLIKGNAINLSMYQDSSFDAVLLLGPLYHIENMEYRNLCLSEAKRVLKPEGKLFVSFISNDMVILTEFSYRNDFFTDDSYDHESFKVKNFPFVFYTVEECREILAGAGLSTLHEIASDGVSELLEDKINTLDKKSYDQYLKYHYHICEKPEMIGRSNHLLYVTAKSSMK
ncbi:methyltransferase domain-containing protein [Proteiniclasticum sp.]|uniref:class I SAM-dependent methyltransferase n=1 Tax=Proteiniclasticum sp. TaxID=2053595 RepID=UPI0028979A14|nr:methyltransferase domain-containing protein [Proteiniclasticum sp.]